jgi:hypothetical protein
MRPESLFSRVIGRQNKAVRRGLKTSSRGGTRTGSKTRLHGVRVVAIGGRATLCSGSAFGGAAVLAPTLSMISSRKISNDFSTKIYCDVAATLHRWRGGVAQLSTILETAVLWRLQLYMNFVRKIVADFSTRNHRKSWGQNRRAAKSGSGTYSSAAPNRNHPHAVRLVFLPRSSTPSGRRFETSPYCFVLPSNTP